MAKPISRKKDYSQGLVMIVIAVIILMLLDFPTGLILTIVVFSTVVSVISVELVRLFSAGNSKGE